MVTVKLVLVKLVTVKLVTVKFPELSGRIESVQD